MRIGNCYTWTIPHYRKRGGWIVVRASLKTWTPHMQWAPLLPSGAEQVTLLEAIRRVLGPRRGYAFWSRGLCYWVARIDGVQIMEYLPPDWIDWSMKHIHFCRTFPVHAVAFSGRVRSDCGEEERVKELIRRHWPDEC